MRPYRIFADLGNLKDPFFFLLVMAKTKRKPSRYNMCMSKEIKSRRGTGTDIKKIFKQAAAQCSAQIKGKTKKYATKK